MDVASPLPGPGNLLVRYYGGYRWVHSNFIIPVMSKINTHFITTFLTSEGEVPIIVSLPINGRAVLVKMYDGIVVQPRTSYCKIFWPYSYCQQREIFHLSTVSVFQLIRCQYVYLLSGISPKQSRQWWCL